MNKSKFSSVIFYVSILIFIIAFNFTDNPSSGWYQQFLPNLNGANIVDMTYTDSLTGYVVTNVDSSSKSYILKTTNGGDNWSINLIDTGRNFSRILFINSSTGFASTRFGTGKAKLFKTTNFGTNWIVLNNPVTFSDYMDISLISENEIWMTFDNPFSGSVYRTTNSGQNWERKYPPKQDNGPTQIHMINSRIGFISNGNDSAAYLKKTTDSGSSWFSVGTHGWSQIYFKDSLTGWRSTVSLNNLRKTTDGGLSWITILTYQSGNPSLAVLDFKILNDSIIWGASFDSYILFPDNVIRGVILKSTNSGLNWGYQLPDTSIRNLIYYTVFFSDSKHGWCYNLDDLRGVHTYTGGDTITHQITEVRNTNTAIPKSYKLNQNYPNPFNPKTIISYELQILSNVKLEIFDISGKNVLESVNRRQNAGKYKIEFSGNGLSSGVYFYSLFIDEKMVDTKKMIMVK